MITCEPSGAAGGLFLKPGIHHRREKEAATGSIMTSIRVLGGGVQERWEVGENEGGPIHLFTFPIPIKNFYKSSSDWHYTTSLEAVFWKAR